ncbi:MAG: SPOR domain-containing protein [Flavobacteriales bacterium]|nr:SPOR domain-containing protein [Flavobacteriales bacterium]
MRSIKRAIFIFLILSAGDLLGQEDNNWIRPQFGVGVGTFTFIGDVGDNNNGYGWTVSDFAYRFRMSHGIYDFMDASLQFTAGRLTSSERSLERNLNFQSEIRGGGLNLMFNFDPLLSPKRLISPYVSIGIESFEFLSKSDLYDAQGRLYHYWTDGTIRDLAQNSPNADNSVLLNRDYTYESDLRELDLDGLGDYDERSFAIPIGLGANVDLSEKAHFTIGTELHLTSTDLIDNISSKGEGVRKGNQGNDKFLFTWFSLNYNFNLKKKPRSKIEEGGEFDHLLADLDNIDSDYDGVNDIIDLCPNTPKEAEVDENGCPKDGDKDLVPDHLDSEPKSASGAVVDKDGITVDDDYFLQQYMIYIDSGKTGDIVKSSASSIFKKVPVISSKPSSVEENRSFFVQVGTNVNELDVNMIDQILSIPDVRTKNIGDSVLYVVGEYDNLPDAVKRKLTLEEEGFDGQVYAEDMGEILDVSDAVDLIEKEIKQIETEKEIPDFEGITTSTNELTWRVQIGAFANELSNNIFSDIRDLIVLPGDDGLTRYMSGSFGNIDAAASHKIDLHLKGYEGAFITVFQGGQRISISEATKGGETDDSNDVNGTSELSEVLNTENTYYRVQLAKFSESIPTDVLNRLMSRSDFDTKSIENESYYIAGKFKTKAKAEEYLNSVDKEIFPDATIIGEFNGKVISAEETQQILKD